jgi:small subunit ribosomal protein S1
MSQTTKRLPTMEDLLSKVNDQKPLAINDQIKGTIIFLAKNQCLIDIPNVGLGVVRGKELYNEDFLARLKVGEDIEAMVIELDNEIGLIELSFRAIGRDKTWEVIKQAYEDQSVVQARIRDVNRGGYLVKVHGIDGFLPASLLSPNHAVKNANSEDNSLLNQMKKYVGQIFEVKIININEDNESLIVSEKAVSDELAQLKLQKYSVGDVIEGTIVGVVDFGIFIRFDEDLEGLIHISEIAWKKVEDPHLDFKSGQKIKAKIVDIDDSQRINLSIKQMLPNPWVKFAKNVKPGDKFKGNVIKVVSYGAIVLGENDIQGLCHISQIAEDGLDSPSQIYDFFKVGDTVDFTVLSLEANEKLYLTRLPLDKAQEIQAAIAAEEAFDDGLDEEA